MSSSMTQPVLGPWTITYSNANISQSNSTFYYDDQLVHWLANFGLPLVNTTLGTIDTAYWYNTACAINFGAQAGACGVMFFVVLVLSQAAKRRTPIFILNVLSLLFGFLRGLFLALYFISNWVKLYPYFSNDYSAIPTKAYVVSVFGTLFPLCMTITVNLSLVLQAYTVTKNMNDHYRYSLIALSSLVFFMAVGFEFAEVVLNNIAIIQAKYYAEQWVQHGALYMQTISVWYFSVIFTSKLVYTLHYRKKHGWKQWSGVKILAAMGGCTMVIPSLFAILEYVNDSISGSFPEAGTLTLTMVALLLPLSSLWASMAINNEAAHLDISRLSGYNMQGGSNNSNSSSSSSSCSHCGHCRGKRGIPSARHTEYVDVEKGDKYGEFSPATVKNNIESNTPHETNSRDSTEMDLQSMGVRVDKSYSLQSAKEDRVLGMDG